MARIAVVAPVAPVALVAWLAVEPLAEAQIVAELPAPTTLVFEGYFGVTPSTPAGGQLGVDATLRHHFLEVGVDARESGSIFGSGMRDLSAIAGLVTTREDFLVLELLCETGARKYSSSAGLFSSSSARGDAWLVGGRIGVSWRFPPKHIVHFGVWSWMDWDVRGAPAPTESDRAATTKGDVVLGFGFRLGVDADL